MSKLIARPHQLRTLERLLREGPVVALLGARQVGKTTLARSLVARRSGQATYLDLEDPRDLARLEEPTLALEPLRGLVVMDEVQNRPDLFPVLRVLADRPRTPARFLVLGSASPELLQQGSETLAGRIAFHELPGLDLAEVGAENLARLWFRGSFPAAYVARSHRESGAWRRDFVRTFVERDLARLGVAIPGGTVSRFWAMLAHYHGQLWNGAELARAFGVSQPTVRHYLDVLTSTFMVRQLPPWAENVGKRVVKSPKVYLSDSGILHTLLGVETPVDLERHPKLGASWEGFLLGQLIARLGARSDQCYFWATHAGAELDLLVVAGSRRLGFEFKRTDSPRVTPSMHSAMATLGLESVTLIHAGRESFPLAERMRAVAAERMLTDIVPLPGLNRR